jgi:glycosyltransferase involved in cell wall biosynthesis
MNNRTRHKGVRLDGVESSGQGLLRALMISTTGELGGAERSFHEVLHALPKEKITVEVCVPPESPLARLCALEQVPVHGVALRQFRRTTNPFVLAGQVRALHQGSKSISDICKTGQFDVIHANTDTAALVAWEVSRTVGVPFIWHCRDMRPLLGVARGLGGAAAAVVAISEAVHRHLLKSGVKPEKIKRIDNGIDLARMYSLEQRAEVRARARAALNIPLYRPVALCVGAYVPWKKHDIFLRVLHDLLPRVPSLLGLLVGSDNFKMNGGYSDTLRNLAADLCLHDQVFRVLKERDDIPELMAAADVLISCSENEPFGRVVAEAGAAGLPVVATQSGGKAEIIEDKVTGLLCDTDDVQGLVEATLQLLGDARLRQEMGNMARWRVERLYDVRRTAAELAQLFEQVVMRKNMKL